MRTVLALILALSGLAAGQEATPKSPGCKFCDVPTGRTALMLGKKACPEGCKKLCCTGTEASYLVTGMTCAGCSGKLKASLDQMDGVMVDTVCHKAGRAVVKFDPAKTDRKKITATITGAGFKVAKGN